MTPVKLDWKRLSKMPEYQKLKKEIKIWDDRGRPYFYSVFSMLKAVKAKTGLDECYVFRLWEKNRSSSFPNYYQGCHGKGRKIHRYWINDLLKKTETLVDIENTRYH